MGKSRGYRWLLIIGPFLLLLLSAFAAPSPAQQQADPSPPQQNQALSTAIILPEDLPPGFVEMTESMKNGMESAMRMFEGKLQGSELQNFTGYWTGDPANLDLVVSGLVGPLTAADRVQVDQSFANPSATYEQLSTAFRSDGVNELAGAQGIGDANLAFAAPISSAGISMILEYVVARRGPVLMEVAQMYQAGAQPLVSTVDLARLLDERVAAVVGIDTAVAFRDAGPTVPELTTHIPTPLDISTKPAVVGANLLLAVLMMLPFAMAAELFTRTLGEHEAELRTRFKPLSWLQSLQGRLDAASVSQLGRHPGLMGVLKLLGVVFFYGLVFSLLDSSWKPFSLQGVVLFLSMTVAYGVIGIADDFNQYRAVRKWGLPAELKVRPTNFMLAVASTLTSRLLLLVPGLMFGTPEALCLEESKLDESQQRKLLKISARTFISIGLAVWLPTIITSRLPLVLPEGAALSIIGGLQAFLLVLFAVALENTFVQMLGFPGGFGQALKKWNRWLWLAGLVLVAFAFLHTLLNPRGELVQALQQGNVVVFMLVTSIFVLVSLALHLYYRRQSRVGAGLAAAQMPAVTSSAVQAQRGDTAALAVDRIPGVSPLSAGLPAGTAGTQGQPFYASIEGTKTCPVCCSQIKAEARICRYCRATFSVRLRGYCLAEHALVEVNEDQHCARCSGELADVHVESRLLQAPAGLPAQLAQSVPTTEGNTKTCPYCGQIIKAEARLCRFCRAQLS